MNPFVNKGYVHVFIIILRDFFNGNYLKYNKYTFLLLQFFKI